MGLMRCFVVVLFVGVVACGRTSSEPGASTRARTPGIRITMDALHQLGGVPPGWKLQPPPGDVDAGRAAFVDLGCHSCHRVEGEPFSAKPTTEQQVGPDLTGMGAHHPAAYFAEAILNPDAVLIDGPGYIGPDGHSVMPDYPDMTVRQIGDLVAYLSSLKTGGAHAGHVMPPAEPVLPANLSARPTAPPMPAKAYFIQTYDVRRDKLAPFEAWWKEQGAKRFLDIDGVVGVDTYVDFTRQQNPYTTIVGFRDPPAMQAFTENKTAQTLGTDFDAFIGEHSHVMQFWSPIYRVPSLSVPP
jgi:mono/diheme cytochrome c family protein